MWYAHTGHWVFDNVRQRGDWERARMVAFYAVAPHTKKIKKATDVMRFHWEKKDGVTREENEAMIKAGTHPLQDYIDGKKAP